MPYDSNFNYRPLTLAEIETAQRISYNEVFNADFFEASFKHSNVLRIYTPSNQAIIQLSQEFASFEANIVENIKRNKPVEGIVDATILGLTQRIKKVSFVEDVSIASPNSSYNTTQAGEINICVKSNISTLSELEKEQLALAIFQSGGDSTKFLGSEEFLLDIQEVNLPYVIKWDYSLDVTTLVTATIQLRNPVNPANTAENFKIKLLEEFKNRQKLGVYILSGYYKNPLLYDGIDSVLLTWTYNGLPISSEIVKVANNEIPILSLDGITVITS